MEWLWLVLSVIAVAWFAISSFLALNGHVGFDKNKKLDRILLCIMYAGFCMGFLANTVEIAAKMGGN